MNSIDLKRRAQELSNKTNIDTIPPTEVGGIMYDTVEYMEQVERNGSTLGIRKTYASIAAMNADTAPKDSEGNPLKKGMLVSIYNTANAQDPDNGKVYAWQNPGWTFTSKIDAAYALKDMINELNISNLYPTGGIGGTNKYDLAGAIAQVPAEYRVQGVKITFLNENGDNESWEYTGTAWAVGSFSEVGARKFSELENTIDDIVVREEIGEDDNDEISVTTEDGDTIVSVSSNGLKAKDLQYQMPDGSYASVKDKQDRLSYDDAPQENSENIVKSGGIYEAIRKATETEIQKEEILELDEGVKIINDENEEIVSVTNQGLKAKDIFNAEGKSLQKINLKNCWEGLTWAEYGDSFTHMFCNGDFSAPYDIKYNTGWGILVAHALNFSNYKGRGISGSSIQWANSRPRIGLVDTLTGALLSTQESKYEDFIDVPEGQTKVRDIGCSWSRITGMFPEGIKNNIDVVTIFLHNDYIKITDECEWVAGDKTDIEWGESSYYDTYGGDYNIETWRGSICSLIMKFQAWMPNTKLILCTPASGSISYGEENKIYPDRAYDGSQFEKSEIMRDLAKRLSIPLIDVNANCGINMLNRTSYLQDYIHPNATSGQKMIAEPFIGGFNRIFKL